MEMNRKTDHVLSEILEHTLSGASENTSAANRASRAWYEVNGNDEERHTVGVFLKENEAGNTLFVYIDSMAKLQDYNANKLIYLARLEESDLDIVDVQFKLSKYKKRKQSASAGKHFAPSPEETLPEVDPEEVERVVENLDTQSTALRAAVSKAAESSLRRQRAEGTED